MPCIRFSQKDRGTTEIWGVRLEDVAVWISSKERGPGPKNERGDPTEGDETGRVIVRFLNPSGEGWIKLDPDQSDAFLKLVEDPEGVHDLDRSSP